MKFSPAVIAAIVAASLTVVGVTANRYGGLVRSDFVVSQDFLNPLYDFAEVEASVTEDGFIVRRTENGFVAHISERTAESLIRPGVIVEPLLEFSIPRPVSAEKSLLVGCGTPPPIPEPPPEPEPIPQPGEKVDWGVSRVGSQKVFPLGLTASAVKVCVLDTGVDTNHPDIKILGGKNFTSTAADDFHDGHSHGTHTAGLVGAVWGNKIGVSGSSQARLLIGKVLNDSGSGYNDWIANGIKWSVDSGCQIISMSLGGPRSSVVESAVQYAVSKRVFIYAAAGNDNSDQVGFPAGYVYPGFVFSVAATDRYDKRAWFSNWGKVELAAPGVEILSTVPGGGYEKMSGTSMATPIAAGVAALYLSVGEPMVFDDLGDAEKFGRGIPRAEGAIK